MLGQRPVLCEKLRQYCMRWGMNSLYQRSILSGQRPVLNEIKRVCCLISIISIIKVTGQYFMKKLTLNDIRAYFYERVIFVR
jgi:hypothetical protein